MCTKSEAILGRMAAKIDAARERFWVEIEEESRAAQSLREHVDSLRAEGEAERAANASQSSQAPSIKRRAP